ncbi:MAG: uracil-DNA glycosylase [Flavobacterium sp.]|nr:uracil-DNA glycosylase [Flavobacterium sp.]
MQAPSWQSKLVGEFQKEYFLQLQEAVQLAYQNSSCYPPKDLLFSAFDYCTFDEVKVIILGQDPYHGPGEANGLAFSVPDGVRIPPSLTNIYREIATDLDRLMLPNSGNLTHWAKQGVLLLNATLTVEKDKPNSHAKMGWQQFTSAVIELLSDQKENLVFMLWGNFAQQKGKQIDRNKHMVLECGHPSPLSANQGKWFGNKHFSLANAYLKAHDILPIEW